jgi:hypothetical protein
MPVATVVTEGDVGGTTDRKPSRETHHGTRRHRRTVSPYSLPLRLALSRGDTTQAPLFLTVASAYPGRAPAVV